MASPNTNTVYETQTLNGSQFEHKIEAQCGENYEGYSGRLWSMYLTDIEKQDREMVERWKGEADSALIFAGLFSAVNAVSLVESYKWLSPDPGDESVKLLAQISRQLVNISNGIPLEIIGVESSQPFKPTASAVFINVTWFGSTVLCLACSVFATLAQQRARRYLKITQGGSAPHERARLRTFMSNGLRRFNVDKTTYLLTAILHLSILLYCMGILDYIFSVNTKIGFSAFGFLFVFYAIYATLTVLPIFFIDCPYITPISGVTWRLYHAALLGIFSTIRNIEHQFRRPLSALYRRVSGSRWPAQWRKTLEKRVNTHRQKFWDGLPRSVELCASEAPQAVDTNALEWTLTSLVENNSDKEIENFAAWVPEFFDTYARPGASEAILPTPLMSDQPPTDPIFVFRLRHLLKTCIPGTSDLAEEERKRRLRVCLRCLWCWVKAYNQNSVPLPSYFPLPSPDMARRLQAEQDATAGVIGRCFVALVTKKLAADIKSPHSSGVRDRDAKLAYLSAILGRTGTEVETLLGQPGAIGLANVVSLTSSEMNTFVTEDIPSEIRDIFGTTLDILLAGDFLTSPDAVLPPDLIVRFHETYFNARQLQVPDWLMGKLGQISDKWPVSRDGPEALGTV